MDTMNSPAAASRPDVDPLTVGKAFVNQYYYIMYNMPEHLHRFYQEISKVGRVGQDGVMRDFSTLHGISEELKSLTSGDFKSAEITSYDTQESHNGGFLLVVTGYFTQNDRLRRKFTQTFFLAPQENGYFVLNDILRFVNEGAKDNVTEPIDGEVVSGKTTRPSLINGKKGSDQAACVSVNPVCKEMSKPLNNENAKDNVRVIVNEEVPEVDITRKEVADDSLKNYDPDDGFEDVPKKSYASVLKVTKDTYGVSAVSLYPKQIPKDQEDQAPSDPSPGQTLKDQGQQASLDPSQMIKSDTVSESIDAVQNGHYQEAVDEGTSIYVKHLPVNFTTEMLETEFKQFGAISNGGIQVINQRGFGYPYGFVEFEEADSAQRAIEASPVMISGQQAFVEEKRSTSRGNRGSGNGGYRTRNMGVRGRGSNGYGYNYRRGGGGGRSFNRRGSEYVTSISSY